ncbi:class I adenylate-forming enzyme family protein [Streptomyces sp. NPDC001904]|uniref:class I adenylate-forming enzyme family protein n=1 Tax=Streptomyces sp. NPDC001904 TaxID=3154531 RepID=UPI00331EC4DE
MFLQRVANKGLNPGTIFEQAAARHPGNLLILDHDLDIAPGLGRRLLVSEVADLVDDLAARLYARGVRAGLRVAVHKSDNFDITLLACAVARLGAVPVLMSPALDAETVGKLLARLEEPHLLTDQAKLASGLAELDLARRTRSVILATGEHDAGEPLGARGDAPRAPCPVAPLDQPALITHTSGTTGTPKLVVHTARTLGARYRPQAAFARGIKGRETVAVHVSFVHSRLFTALAISLWRGFPVVMLSDGSADHVADLFARVRPGLLETHPNSFMEWESLADDPRAPLSDVRYFSSTFDAIHPRTMDRLLSATRRRSPVFVQLYGQSEVGPVAGRTYTRRRSAQADGRCLGIPFPGMTGIRVVSRDGRPPGPENPGYIEVRTDGRAVTYLGEHERYTAQENDGWWRMGDVGYRTRWGCLHLLDREVDYIASVGSTLAIEDRLLVRLDQLTELVIVDRGDGVAVPVVCTRDDEPIDERTWERAVSDLPAMCRPVHRRLADLPRTATSKIKRLQLAAEIAAEEAA